MLLNDQENVDFQDVAERILPYQRLKGFVDKLLRRRVSKPSDAEDIAQNVFRRSWQWAEKNDRTLTEEEWRKLIAKISFNEINRFYSKRQESLIDDISGDDVAIDIPDDGICPQFIIEIVEGLRQLPLRQRLAIVLHEAEILPYLKIVMSDEHIAGLLEMSSASLASLEIQIPLSEIQITQVIEILTMKPCKSSIRDERCKGRKLLKRRLFQG